MAVAIRQSGKKAQAASATTLTTTFSTDGGTGAAAAGSVLLAFVVADDTISSVVAVGGGGGTFTQIKLASAFCNTAVYRLTAAGGETGITSTIAVSTGQIIGWYEATGAATTEDASSSATPAGSATLAVGTVAPTDSDGIFWCQGNDAARVYDTTSLGTLDSSVASTQTPGTKVGASFAHILATATSTSPTCHVSGGLSTSNTAGVIVALSPAAAAAGLPDLIMAPMRGH